MPIEISTLSIENLTYRYPESSKSLGPFSLSFPPGKISALFGPNGSGKTTLMKLLCRLLKPHSGEITWKEDNLSHYNRLRLSQTITFVPQNTQLAFDFTVQEFVAMGRYCHGSRLPALVDANLKDVEAYDLRHQLMTQLSQGEKQRIYIARALTTEAPILVFDEPTAHLDLQHQLLLWDLMKRLCGQGKTLIISNHDLRTTWHNCDNAIILKEGKCLASGKCSKILTASLLQEIFGFKPKLRPVAESDDRAVF